MPLPPAEWITSTPTPWFSTSELLEYLDITEDELDLSADLFVEGIHFKFENAKDKTSRRLWRLDLVDELLCLPIPPLEKEAMLKAVNNHIICSK